MKAVTVGALLLIMTGTTSRAQGQADSGIAAAVVAIDQIDELRSSLAGTFLQTGAPAGKQAFAEVCRPVGQAMKDAGRQHGWVGRQLAVKYRNPANAADPEATRILGLFERDSSLLAVTLRTYLNGQPGRRYLRRITVEASCLLCHGARDARPAFVREQYADDRAFDFRAGDLRGAYSVFIPDGR
ncbi:MAG: DUF3365 domain-containing protein [bacterium]